MSDLSHLLSSQPSICPHCEGLQRGVLGDNNLPKRYEKPVTTIQKQMAIGCLGCALLWDALKFYKYLWSELKLSELVITWKSPRYGNTFAFSLIHFEDGSIGFETIVEVELLVSAGKASLISRCQTILDLRLSKFG